SAVRTTILTLISVISTKLPTIVRVSPIRGTRLAAAASIAQEPAAVPPEAQSGEAGSGEAGQTEVVPAIPDSAAVEELLRMLRPQGSAGLPSGTGVPGGAGRSGVRTLRSGRTDTGALDADGQPEGPPGANRRAGDIDALRGAISVNEFEQITLRVVDEDLATVLRLLSIESERNIIVSEAVSARVTAEFYGVGFYEALDAMLEANGLGYVERGRFIHVHTSEELGVIRARAVPREARVLELHYLSPSDAAQFAVPLLSEGGTITTPEAAEPFSIPDEDPVGSDRYAAGSLIVVHDFPANIDAIAALLDELDARPRQVLIEATILQAQIEEDNAFGVDFSVLADLEFKELLNPLAAVSGLLDGGVRSGESGAVTSSVGNTGGAGGLKVGVISDDIAVFIRALDEVTDTTTISKPKLLTLNRQPARVLVGTRVGFLNSTTTNDNTTTQEVDFLNTGTQLRVRPFIMRDGQIRLELKPQVSFATLRPTTAPGGATVSIPDEDTTELVTNLIVRDGQTVVLGGLFTESARSTRRQVPGLGDIPVFGAAFRGHEDEVTRDEIIFLIRPTIVGDEELSRQGRDGVRASELARLGSRRGLLPWSRERRVGQLLIDAEKLRRSGDTGMAMMKVERALGLYPQNPEAARMRDSLFADEREWPAASILDSILGGAP
ncbi:MAG: hypothetical protein AAF235_08005, partial [Planctomycetota bacterium]